MQKAALSPVLVSQAGFIVQVMPAGAQPSGGILNDTVHSVSDHSPVMELVEPAFWGLLPRTRSSSPSTVHLRPIHRQFPRILPPLWCSEKKLVEIVPNATFLPKVHSLFSKNRFPN